jgi:hypothetical protein
MVKHSEESIHRTSQNEWPSVARREINHGFQFTLPAGTKFSAKVNAGQTSDELLEN